MEQDLKRLIAARGQLKGTITRLYNFISNETDFNKDISVLDSQNCEDFERIENQYFAIMAAINEKLTPKTNCEVGKPSTSSSNLTKLPRIEIPRFSGQVLSYLGERLSPDQCDPKCDNCMRKDEFKPVDVTEDCKRIVRWVRSASTGRAQYTLLHVADALRGSMQQRLKELQNSDIHGRCKSWPRGDPPRLLRQLVVRGLLAERLVLHNDIASAYLALGPQVDQLMNGNLKIIFPMKCEKKSSLVTSSDPSRLAPAAPVTALVRRIEDRCYADLVEACREMGAARNITLVAVMPLAALKAMAARLPETAEDMLSLPHVTRANYDKFGHQLLTITSQYAVEKMGLLMQYQDELEAETSAQAAPQNDFQDDSGAGSDTDWGALGRASGGGSSGGGYRGRGRRRGGVRKRFKRGGGKAKTASAAKKKAVRGGAGGAGRGSPAAAPSWKTTVGHKLGTMPMPKHSSVVNTRPGVFKNSKLSSL